MFENVFNDMQEHFWNNKVAAVSELTKLFSLELTISPEQPRKSLTFLTEPEEVCIPNRLLQEIEEETMDPSLFAAAAAKHVAVSRLKRACKELEQYTPPDDPAKDDVAAVVAEPPGRPVRRVGVVECQEGGAADLPGRAQAGSTAVYMAGPPKVVPSRGSRWRKANAGVIKQHIEAVEAVSYTHLTLPTILLV